MRFSLPRGSGRFLVASTFLLGSLLGVAPGQLATSHAAPATAAPAAGRFIPRPLAVRFAWTESARDPFLDASRRGKDALLGNRPNLAPAAAPLGYGMKEFLEDLSTAAEGKELKVQGVFPGEGGTKAVVTIAGQTFAEGDWMPVRTRTRDFESFAAVAKSKGLEFERVGPATSTPGGGYVAPASTAAGAKKGPPPTDVVILLQMGKIQPPDPTHPGGVELLVPGYHVPLAVLPYRFPPRLTRGKTPSGIPAR